MPTAKLTHLTRAAWCLAWLLACAPSQAQICTREYAPVCGQIQGEPSPKTFSNACMLRAAHARFVSEGQCSGPSPVSPLTGGDTDAHGCKPSTGHAWNPELASCVRPWMSSAVTLEVAPHRRLCMGMIEQQCLMVRELVPGQNGTRFEPLFVGIQGYDHAAGQGVTLRVRKDRIDNPPADASNTTYRLLRILP